MRKIYLFVASLLFAVAVNAADRQVLVVSENLPADDAIIQMFMDSINSIDGVEAVHMVQGDYSAVTDFSGYHCVLITENGGSASATAVQDAGWQVPVIHLKTYALYKGTNPIMAQDDVDWYGEKDTEFDEGDGTLIVEDNEDILMNYSVGDEVDWTTGFNDGTGAGEAHVQGFDLTASQVGDIALFSTLLAKSKWHEDQGVQSKFMWKVDENTLTKNLFIWGIHHEYLQYATADFYSILKNATMWAMGMELVNGVKAVEKSEINIYPNPVLSDLYVGNASKVKNISILDVTGKVVVEAQNSGASLMVINTDNMVDGLYVVKVETLNGDFYTQKLVK